MTFSPARNYPKLNAALLSLRWSGFLSGGEIARRLELWSNRTVHAELGHLVRQGLLWRMIEMIHPERPLSRFAWPRHDAGELVVLAQAGFPRRRGWRPVKTPEIPR